MPSDPYLSIQWDGQRISKPGLYAGIPLDDYHRGDICDGPSLSSSSLRLLWAKSPKHFWDVSPLNPLRVIKPDTEAFIVGRATHHLITGESGFSARYIIRPEKAPDGRAWHGANKSVIKWLADAKRSRKAVLTPSMAEDIQGMAIALGSHPLVQQGVLNGLVERSLFWKDPETGVWLKARPDVIPTFDGAYGDLKTTESVLYLDVQQSVRKFGYHQQGAMVLEGAAALGLPVESFNLVWVEKQRPHCVRAEPIPDEDLLRGARQNRVAIRTFHQCWTSKDWPAPGEDRGIGPGIGLSERAREEIDTRLNLQLREAA